MKEHKNSCIVLIKSSSTIWKEVHVKYVLEFAINLQWHSSNVLIWFILQGVGRRFASIVLKKADIDATKRAGELSDEEVDKVITIMQNPRQYKIPDWFLNRQKDIKDGKFYQILANNWESKLRDDLERLKKIKAHRGLRHYWGYVTMSNQFSCIRIDTVRELLSHWATKSRPINFFLIFLTKCWKCVFVIWAQCPFTAGWMDEGRKEGTNPRPSVK